MPAQSSAFAPARLTCRLMRVMMRGRKNLRLDNFDYASDGYYFITIHTYQNRNMFCNNVGAGPCAGPVLSLNKIGLMIKSIWSEIPNYYPHIDIDEFIIMPNHMHGIVVISNQHGRPQGGAPTKYLSLYDVVPRFKSLTTTRYRQLTQISWKLWQRSFYDHIIRNEKSLGEIRKYIQGNPVQWKWNEKGSGNI